MNLQRLYSYTRQAIDDYEMIEEGDHIAIGISGGKDSLTLLYALAGLRRFYPKSFKLTALTVDLGYPDFDLSRISALCQSLEVPYEIVRTQIADMVRDNQCSLCARLRKGALTTRAAQLGCTKIAYAHNMDDVIETMMMSLIYEGRMSTFWPVTYYEDVNLSIIRPLMYVPLEDVRGFANREDLPVTKNPCPYDGITARRHVRDLLKDINRMAPGAKRRMMTAVCHDLLPMIMPSSQPDSLQRPALPQEPCHKQP